MRGNAFTSNLPGWLANATSLKVLHAAHNQLSGTLPSELGRLLHLQEVDLDGNSFTVRSLNTLCHCLNIA